MSRYQSVFMVCAAWVAFALGLGCPRVPAFGSLVASQGSTRTLEAFSAALLGRRSEDLLQLFSPECLRECRGFDLSSEGSRGELHLVRWSPRAEAGSLADDLHGQLMLYQKVTRARLAFLRLTMEGPRRADALVALAVDGELAKGAKRSDRGTLRLSLRRWADDTWRIEAFALGAVRSVISRAPTFGPQEVMVSAASLGQAAPLEAPVDLGAPDADRGRGLVVLDVDGDGHLDVFLPGPGLGRLLFNDGKGRLKPGPPLAQVADSDVGALAIAGDLDGDGAPDLLVVTSHGQSRWLMNRGGRLVPTQLPGLDGLGPGAAAALMGTPGGGGLSLVFAPSASWRGSTGDTPPGPRLYRYRDGRFELDKGALPTGLEHTASFCAADLDGDGRTDIVHVSRLGPVTVLLDRGGRFEPAAREGPATLLGRGCTLADLDGDGRLDVVIAAVRSSEAWKAAQEGFPLPGPQRGAAALRARLQGAAGGSFWLRNEGAGRFSSRRLASEASLGWDVAVAAEDVSGDGAPELVLAGGFHWIRKTRPQDDAFFSHVLPARLAGLSGRCSDLRLDPRWGSLGATRGATLLLRKGGRFVDVGVPSGLDLPPGVRAAAWADLDRDGRPELLLRLSDGSLVRHAMRTPLGDGRALTLRLASGRGVHPGGATVFAQALERRALAASDGAATDRPWGEVRLGLGKAPRADRIEVRWPDGSLSELQDLDGGAAYSVSHGSSEPRPGLARQDAAVAGGHHTGPGGASAGHHPEGGPRASPARPLTLAGFAFDRLPEIPVMPAQGPPSAQPRPLRSFFGKRGTLLYLPPSACPACPAYLAKLAKAGLLWAKEGISVVVLSAALSAAHGTTIPGLTLLRIGAPTQAPGVLTPAPGAPNPAPGAPLPSSGAVGPRPAPAPPDSTGAKDEGTQGSPSSGERLGLLFVLGPEGRPRTIYIATQPDPALLRHHLSTIQ